MAKRKIKKQYWTIGVIVIVVLFMFLYESPEKETRGTSLTLHLYDEDGNEITQRKALVGDIPNIESLSFSGKITNDGNIPFCALTYWVFTSDESMTPIKENILTPLSAMSISPYWKSPLFYCSDQLHDYGIGWDGYTIGYPMTYLGPGESREFTTPIVNIRDNILTFCDKGDYNVITGICEQPAVNQICAEGVYNALTNTCEVFPEIDSPFKFRVIAYYDDCCGIEEMVDPVSGTYCNEGVYNPIINKCIIYHKFTMTDTNGETCEISFKDDCQDKLEIILDKSIIIKNELARIVNYRPPTATVKNGDIEATFYLRNIGGDMLNYNLVEIQPKNYGREGLESLDQDICHNAWPQNVHKSFILNAGETGVLTLTSPIQESGSYYLEYVMADRCCVNKDGTSPAIPCSILDFSGAIDGPFDITIVGEIECGDGVCAGTPNEDFISCPSDCNSWCGDQICDTSKEDINTCGKDCKCEPDGECIPGCTEGNDPDCQLPSLHIEFD